MSQISHGKKPNNDSLKEAYELGISRKRIQIKELETEIEEHTKVINCNHEWEEKFFIAENFHASDLYSRWECIHCKLLY
jgi:hypothetical protein